MVTIKTSKGDIQVELHTDTAPATVENFLNYVRNGYYANTIFHRVIKGFMIQGGGLDEQMTSQKTNSPIKNEAAHAKPNKRGTLAMARTNDPHSATSQFFINVVDNTFLNYSGEQASGAGYCVFGEVVEGMDVVDAIAQVKTGHNKGHDDVPVEVVKILEVVEA